MQKSSQTTITDGHGRADFTFTLTNRLAFRGVYKSLSVCVYGILPPEHDLAFEERFTFEAPRHLGSGFRQLGHTASDEVAELFQQVVDGDADAIVSLAKHLSVISSPLDEDDEGFVAEESEWDGTSHLRFGCEAVVDACLSALGQDDITCDAALRLLAPLLRCSQPLSLTSPPPTATACC